MFAGFSFNGYSALAASASNNVNNSGVLSAPPSPFPASPSPTKRSNGAPSTPLLRPMSSPSRSSRDKSVDKSLPNLGLFSSNGRLSSVRTSEGSNA